MAEAGLSHVNRGVRREGADFVERVRKVVDHVVAAQRLLADGPLDYYLLKLAEHSEALLTRFAPFRPGDRARICREIDCRGGWAKRGDTLAVGAIGTAQSVDYLNGKFIVEFVPDREWYEDHNGDLRECQSSHAYCLSEADLTLVERAAEQGGDG